MARDLTVLPKAQLHLHLTGAMRPTTLRELAVARRQPVPEHDGREVREWAAFQARYDAARSLIRTPDDIRRVLVEAATDDAADGCGWLEVQVDPTSYASSLGGLSEALEAVLTAAKSAPIPVGRLLGAGVPVALASDDPLLFGVGLAGQYVIGREELELSDDDLAAIAAYSIRSSRAPASLRQRLLAGVEDWRRAPDHP